MVQLHRRFSGEQVAFLLRAYAEGLMSRVEVQEALHLGRSRFFALWREYRHNPEAFSVTYQRTSPDRVTPATQMAIEQELLREQALVENPELPISGYNYSALRDRLAKQGISVSVNTIIDRAKKLGCHRPRRKKRAHDREVLTASVGALIQHDGSSHRWSPFSSQKWALITSIDDFSRMILFADFFPAETSWAHIQATQSLIEAYGVPLRYYVDSLRVFRFVQGRDSVWRKHILQTDDVDTQWGKMIPKDIGTMCASWASRSSLPSRPRPRARSKDLTAGCRIASSVPAPWRGSAPWSRSGKSCEKKSIATTITQVHSTTREIPGVRFAKAMGADNSLFRPFTLPEPYTSPKDVFCLRERRMVNAYRRISLYGHELQVPKAPLRNELDIHMIPNLDKQAMELRLWWEHTLIHRLALPLDGFKVHL